MYSTICLSILIINAVKPYEATSSLPSYCTTPDELDSLIVQHSRCQSQVQSIIQRAAPEIMAITVDTIGDIAADRDRALHQIRQQYDAIRVTDRNFSDTVARASELAAEHGVRKRNTSSQGIERVVARIRQALADSATACASIDDASPIVAAIRRNTNQHVQRLMSRSLETARAHSEHIIASTIRIVVDYGKAALYLNDRVLSTRSVAVSAAGRLQRELDDVVRQGNAHILAVFGRFDPQIEDAVRQFLDEYAELERSNVAVVDYLRATRAGCGDLTI